MTKATVGLVIIDTDSSPLALRALQHSELQFPFDQVQIFSDKAEPWGGRTVNIIPRINSRQAYSEFVIFDLSSYIKTDFFIIIQWDGFLLRGDQFSPHFYHYDYIGAPWLWLREFNVGNGGFSWRSKKLADAVADLSRKLRSEYERQKPEDEDFWICRTNRVLLESEYGINFCGEEMAAHFSMEHGGRRYPTFGFHGPFHLPHLYADNLDWLLQHLPARVLQHDRSFQLMADSLRRVSDRHYQLWLQKRGQR